MAAAEAGVAWDRILFYWSELQPGGPDEWNGYHVPDDWLALASSSGREVVGLLKHTPEWATDGPVGCGVPRGLDLPIDDPSNLWAMFVRRTVSAYSSRISHWIVWNEPDIAPQTYGAEWCGTTEEYYRLLKVTYLAAHELDPDVTIHLAGLTHWHDPNYLRRFLAVATSDPSGPQHGYYFDVVSLHIYFRTETVPDIIRATRAALAAYGVDKPIWLNETNAPPNTDPEWYMPQANYEISLEEQAGFLLQSFSLALASGAERIAVYKLVDHDLPPHFEPFGIIRPDSSRRPAYYAFRLITEHYAGTHSATVDQRPQYTIVTLSRGYLATRVMWARTEADTAVTIPALAAQATLIDQTGAEQIIQPVGGNYVISLPRARCADSRGCIIGGPTFLLVEETGTPPPPTEEPTSEATATAQSTPSPTPSPTLEPTATPRPTHTPSPSPTLTPSPTATERPSSTAPVPRTATPRPADPGSGSAEQSTVTSTSAALPLAAGVGGVLMLSLAVLLFLKQRR